MRPVVRDQLRRGRAQRLVPGSRADACEDAEEDDDRSGEQTDPNEGLRRHEILVGTDPRDL
jgi:hypothetical protein